MSHATAAHPAAGRYDSLHGDEGIDLEPYMERALEEVVETVLNYGMYPQPRRVSLYFTTGSTAPRQFDLYDWILETNAVDPSELREYFILSLNDHSSCGMFEDARSKWEKKLTEKLLDHFAGSEIVRERAEKLAEEGP